MNEIDLGISKRQQKTEQTKKKLCDAMGLIMEKYDYSTVTIRNICKVSGVAYGSFYNLFESKEDFLRYYLTEDFVGFKDSYYKKHKEFGKMDPIERSIDIFVCCAKYNVNKGIRFISGFYSPMNMSLCPLENQYGKEYSFTPLASEATKYLLIAKENGTLIDNADVTKIVNEYCFLFNGITFNWCISAGQYDMVNLVREYFHDFVDKYKK